MGWRGTSFQCLPFHLRRNWTPRGCAKLLRHVLSCFFKLCFSVRSLLCHEWGDQIHHEAALAGYLNKHQGSLECCLRTQCFTVVFEQRLPGLMTVACCSHTHALWCRSLSSEFIYFYSFFLDICRSSHPDFFFKFSNHFHMLTVHGQILSVGERDRTERIISQFDKSLRAWSLTDSW